MVPVCGQTPNWAQPFLSLAMLADSLCWGGTNSRAAITVCVQWEEQFGKCISGNSASLDSFAFSVGRVKVTFVKAQPLFFAVKCTMKDTTPMLCGRVGVMEPEMWSRTLLQVHSDPGYGRVRQVQRRGLVHDRCEASNSQCGALECYTTVKRECLKFYRLTWGGAGMRRGPKCRSCIVGCQQRPISASPWQCLTVLCSCSYMRRLP